ncbi:SHOCT domain-containing protein [Stackebrandtia soli]|uniref:SHOCT domain-containing protein n=1 Tax=Stackebrandtia soli TaxID=1892856 RepID=UPI0039ED1974
MTDIITEAVIASNLHEHGPGFGGGPWFLLIPLFWIAVFVTVGIVFKRRFRNHGAVGVLRERFARGEVSEEEYRERLEVLRKR